MKKYIYLLFILSPLFSLAQKTDKSPFPGATKIIIDLGTVDESPKENYEGAAQKLLDAGYMIEKSDKEFYQLYTAPVKVYGEGVSRWLSLYVLASKGKITVVGRLKNTEGLKVINIPQDTDNYEVLPYKNSKLMKEVFKKMTDFASTIAQGFVYSE